MKLLDANILLIATDTDDARHARMAEWFDTQMNGTERLGIPDHSLIAFLRISTNPRSRSKPLSMQAALEFVEDWLESEVVWVPPLTGSHFSIVAELLRQAPRSSLVSDAHLAALAIEHGLTVCSTDVDFRLFKGLRLLNPLE